MIEKKPILEGSTATEIADLVKRGKITVSEVTKQCLNLIEEKDALIEALAYWNREDALAQVERVDNSNKEKKILAGIPIAVKDIIDVKNQPTGYGANAIFQNYPAEDASCVALLKEAGAIIVGKTTTAEFAFSTPPKTKNPWNLEHTPGGSSSGSAAAVAANFFPIAIGTQTGGSIIRPASFCGVYGFKPTFNVVPRNGLKSFSESFDTIGWFANTIDDIKLVLNVLAPKVANFSINKNPLRVGFCKTPFWDQASRQMQQQTLSLAKTLNAAAIDLSSTIYQISVDHYSLMAVEMARSLRYEFITKPNYLSKSLKQLINMGLSISANDELQCLKRLANNRAKIDELFESYDLLIAPASPGSAPNSLKKTGDSIFNRFWSAMHVPCLSIPLFKDINGMPMGVQLIGKRYFDAQLLCNSKKLLRIIASQNLNI